ncbi:MAG: hypothetical protein ACRD09_05280, partial [Vicinamibacterales bacterium]
HDEGAAQFIDADTLVFPSTAVDPNQPITPEVARNGNIYNVWTLNLKNGELRQYTDTLTGNLSPVILKEGRENKIAFVTYYKGEYGVHTLTRQEPVTTVASSEFGVPGPVMDFVAPLSHTLIATNKRRKGRFEKLFLEGRPPVALGVTSGGDVFGGTQVTFTDVLGDQQFNLFVASVSQYRTMSFSYINLSRRLQYAAQAYSQTQFFYGLQPGVLFDPQFAYIDRDFAIATRTARGGSLFGIYPLNRYARLELSAGLVQFNEEYNDPLLEELAQEYQQQVYGTTLFRNGTLVPFGISFVQETTIFREFGPLAGNTVRISYDIAPKIGDTLSRQTVDGDARYYLRLGTNGVLALRGRGFKSWGDFPDFTYFGGNSELRGYDYLEFLGQRAFFTNAELRFPLIDAMLTPLGVMGGIRGVLFAGLGGAGYNDVPFKVWDTSDAVFPTIIDFRPDPVTGQPLPVFGEPRAVSGFRLVDGRASYGISLETFAIGFPIHFDWSWRTLFNRDYEDVVYALYGGSEWFRKPRFNVWIGYDF